MTCEYFLKPFEAAVKEGHVQSVTASYNEIDGIPSQSNKHLLDSILRQEWGSPFLSFWIILESPNFVRRIMWSDPDEASARRSDRERTSALHGHAVTSWPSSMGSSMICPRILVQRSRLANGIVRPDISRSERKRVIGLAIVTASFDTVFIPDRIDVYILWHF